MIDRAIAAFRQAGKAERIAMVLIALGALFGTMSAIGHFVYRWSQQPASAGKPLPRTVSAPDLPMDLGPNSPFSAEALGPRVSLMRTVRLSPPFDPVDSIRFRGGDVTIQLADVDGPGVGAVCMDAEQLRWGCGRQGRAALYNLIRLNTVTCRGAPVATASGGTLVLLAQCEVGGRDLATELVRQGFARTHQLTTPNRRAALAEAQAARRGLWNGDWTILW